MVIPRPPLHPLVGDFPAGSTFHAGQSVLGVLASQAHLTNRDLAMVDWLDRHGVLTTAQLTAAFFSHPNTANHRLNKLRAIGLVDRFHRPLPTGGFGPWHWVIGPLGAQLAAAAREAAAPTPRALRIRHAQLAASPTLLHLLGTNQFFVDLYAHTRRNPHTHLLRWWSERDTATRYRGRIHPDGHALWRHRNTVVGLFLEFDRSTENLGRLVRKLSAYDQLAADGGPAYAVLFWLHSAAREANLHAALAERRAGWRVPVATGVRDGGHPAGRVWAVPGQRRRRSLAQLPCDHGDPGSVYNPNLRDPDLDLEL
jgi:Replication-relaxation